MVLCHFRGFFSLHFPRIVCQPIKAAVKKKQKGADAPVHHGRIAENRH